LKAIGFAMPGIGTKAEWSERDERP